MFRVGVLLLATYVRRHERMYDTVPSIEYALLTLFLNTKFRLQRLCHDFEWGLIPPSCGAVVQCPKQVGDVEW